nr:hypothetical protein Itr_chr04CG18460 [Ipomoea trifida]
MKGAICDEVQLEGGPPREEMPHFHFLEKTRKTIVIVFIRVVLGRPWVSADSHMGCQSKTVTAQATRLSVGQPWLGPSRRANSPCAHVSST